MYILNSSLINTILTEYTEKVKFSYNKIPYDSWRTLKKLSNANTDYAVKIEITGENSILYLTDTKTDITSEIFVTDGFAYLVKERTIHMVDTNPNMNVPKTENKSATTSASRRGFNLNLDFGPINDGVAFSPYGLAVRNSKGEFYTYNPATAQTIDVTGFTFDFKGMIYRMPVAVKDIKVGDMIIHKNKPMFVTSIDNTNIEVIDILDSEIKSIIPTTNPFGFNFVTKIVSLVNFSGNAPSPDQPFGNIMPMMIASAVLGDSDGEGSMFENMDMGKLFMLNMMTNGSNPFGNLFNFNGAAETQV